MTVKLLGEELKYLLNFEIQVFNMCKKVSKTSNFTSGFGQTDKFLTCMKDHTDRKCQQSIPVL